MKKIMMLITCFFIVVSSFSQSSHIEFKGIPLDGKLSDFVSKLGKEGFTFEEYVDEGTIAIMKGDFAGDNVKTYILSTKKSNIVWKVVVFYGEKESWYSLKRDYLNLKELYTKKYGYPEKHFEFFSNPYEMGDGYELQALKKEKCTYISYYKLPTGRISVRINKFCEIQVDYEDQINCELNEEEKENAILDDI